MRFVDTMVRTDFRMVANLMGVALSEDRTIFRRNRERNLGELTEVRVSKTPPNLQASPLLFSPPRSPAMEERRCRFGGTLQIVSPAKVRLWEKTATQPPPPLSVSPARLSSHRWRVRVGNLFKGNVFVWSRWSWFSGQNVTLRKPCRNKPDVSSIRTRYGALLAPGAKGSERHYTTEGL